MEDKEPFIVNTMFAVDLLTQETRGASQYKDVILQV